MNPDRPKVILLGSGSRAPVREHLDRFRPIIERHADIVLEDLEFSRDLESVEADWAVVLGGDGSILRAARQMGSRQLPVIGVNLGKLGFLADLTPDDFIRCFPSICANEFRLVEQMMLRCEVRRKNESLAVEIGLNEMAVLAGPPYTMLHVDLYVDSELATTYSCDGLIIGTPVGSTAHSLSAGGPILQKSLQAFLISPICPHTLTVRPVVDAADRHFEVVVREPGEHTSVVVDGRSICTLAAEDRVSVERAEQTFRLIEVPGRSYYRTLRKKLGWGGNFWKP